MDILKFGDLTALVTRILQMLNLPPLCGLDVNYVVGIDKIIEKNLSAVTHAACNVS
jgi:hypothetical protein